MAESQSRYGIMEELNNRKIKTKEELATLERETDEHTYKEEEKIMNTKRTIEDKEKSYKREFQDFSKQKLVQLKLLKQDYERKEESLEKELKNKEETYEDDFQVWKNATEQNITFAEKSLERYKEVQESKIKEKQAIIDEINNAILSLKELSKEQGKE